MRLHDDHLYHGGALIQIAEHDKFTAINSLEIGQKRYKNAYRINNDVAVWFKYASKATSSYNEYVFNFGNDHLDQINEISKHCKMVYVAMVCVKVRQVCCLSSVELFKMIEERRRENGGDEGQYVVLVTADYGKSLRVYMNYPGKRGKYLGSKLVIPKNNFPSIIFR